MHFLINLEDQLIFINIISQIDNNITLEDMTFYLIEKDIVMNIEMNKKIAKGCDIDQNIH